MRSLILTALAIVLIGYAISMINKNVSSSRYERKPKDQWNRLSEGDDPTQSQDDVKDN
jgi:hypothetical protein